MVPFEGGQMANNIERRKFIAGLGGAVAWPLAVHAQQGERMRRIGVMMPYIEADPEGQAGITLFQKTLREAGWIEGRNVQTFVRWANASESIVPYVDRNK